MNLLDYIFRPNKAKLIKKFSTFETKTHNRIGNRRVPLKYIKAQYQKAFTSRELRWLVKLNCIPSEFSI